MRNKNIKLLILEDSHWDMELIRNQLTDAGYILDLTHALNEQDYILALKKNAFDLILSDFRLPGFTAFDSLEIRNEICPHTPFICISGSLGEETAIELLKKGAVDYVLKDKPERLPFSVKRALAEAEEKAAHYKAEMALKESEEKFRNIFQNHAAVKLIIDPHTGDIVEANQAAANFYGWSMDELKSKNIVQINSLPFEAVKREMDKVGSLGRVRFEFKHYKADGSQVDVEVFSSSVQTGGKQFLHSIIHDVSEKKKAEKNLKLLNKAIESSSVAVVITDEEGRIIYTNPFFTRLTGYTPEEVKGQNPRFLKSGHQTEGFYTEMWNTILSGNTWEGEMLNKKKNGDLFWEKAIISPITDNKGVVNNFIAIKEDITYRKKAEETERELEFTKKSVQFKQNFLAKMSHEIRTPLTGVLGMIDVLEQTHLTEEQSDFVNTIKASGENLKEIINQVLEYSKIEAGKISLNPEIFEFRTLLENAKFLYKDSMNAGVDLLIEIDSHIPKYIKADKFRLSQVVNNFLSNAIKFTHQGSVSMSAKLDFVLAETDVLIRVEVRDTGIGIPESLQKKLFNPFVQSEQGERKIYEGTGLGLSICKELVGIMDGEIGVLSEEGKGSSFWFTFLASKASEIPSKPIQSQKKGLKKLRVLVTEDAKVIQKIVSLMLKSMGHEVSLANNGKQALELYQPGLFDLILMDVQMPEMDGVTATQILKEKYTQLPPIVGLSANAFEGDKEKYIAMGMDEYLTKPFNKVEFENMVSRIF